MVLFEIVADCDACGKGKVPYEPPKITECSYCESEFICHPDGSMVLVRGKN